MNRMTPRARCFLPNLLPAASAAFRSSNDGCNGLIVVNAAAQERTFAVRWSGQSFPYTLAAGVAVTFFWS